MVELRGFLVSSRVCWVTGKSRCSLEPLRHGGLESQLFSWYEVWEFQEGNGEM